MKEIIVGTLCFIAVLATIAGISQTTLWRKMPDTQAKEKTILFIRCTNNSATALSQDCQKILDWNY